MMDFFKRVNNNLPYGGLVADLRSRKNTAVFGVQPNEKPFVAGNVPDRFVVYVCSDFVDSQRILRTLNAIKGQFEYLPYRDDVLLYKNSYSKNSVRQRNKVLSEIIKGKLNGVVVCAQALMQPLPEFAAFNKGCIRLSQSMRIDIKQLCDLLIANGYVRTDSITADGEFAVRGDIVDISVGIKYRLDFWDDEIESIRLVKNDNTSGGKVPFFDVYPMYDTVGMTSDGLAKLYQFAVQYKNKQASVRLQQIVGELSATASSADNAWLIPFVRTSELWDYLPDDTVVMWDEPKRIQERVNFLYQEQDTRLANLLEAGEVTPFHNNTLADRYTLYSHYGRYTQCALQTLPYACNIFKVDGVRQLRTSAVPSYYNSLTPLAKDISDWKLNGYETVLLAGDEEGVKLVSDTMRELGVYLSDKETLQHNSADGLILPIAVERGFVSHSAKLVVVGTRDLGRSMGGDTVRSVRKPFLSVNKGDYVVHDFHGVGLCEGIVKVDGQEGSKDYIAVLYKNGDKLYVPVENSNLLTRYSGGEHPTLSKLGGQDFQRVKDKVKSSIKAMSVDLLKLYSEREKARGFVYNLDSYLQQEFDRSFPYTETADQLKCIAEIEKDLTSDKIMDRLLVGDVGYGKTEVAMRTAFRAVENEKQVAVLVPTTILAEQHYKTFSQRMSPFNIKVRCLNRFRSAEQQAEIIKQLKEGEVDIVIGTHRLLSKDVKFKNLSMLILDEEQRFGVEHKELIKDMKKNVDVLTLSATPIPRTLHMALSGIRDISTITTPPRQRLAVETFVAEENPAMIRDVILRELARDGQVYLLYNKVQSIDRIASDIARLVPEAKIGVAHGQMDEKVLEERIFDFQQGRFNVLVCTTIIENGIDIPNANTLIVFEADKLGLSQLYQLKGRVGRSDRPAYAYFTYPANKILSEVAYKRLTSITEYSELGSGFKIAMKDLEIRGAGNILGREQHGHMVKVGYDMYARLLKESVDELKGVSTVQRKDVVMEVDIDAYAPDDYIESATERMDFYQDLAGAADLPALEKLCGDIEDQYGSMPKPTVNLFTVARLKILAGKAGVEKLTLRNGMCKIVFDGKTSFMKKEVFDAVASMGKNASLSTSEYGVVLKGAEFLQKSRLIDATDEFLTQCCSH